MSNIKNRKREKELSVQQYFEQQAKVFEDSLFSCKEIELFKYLSIKGLDSIIAHAQEEFRRRQAVEVLQEEPGLDDGLSAEEKFKRARE